MPTLRSMRQFLLLVAFATILLSFVDAAKLKNMIKAKPLRPFGELEEGNGAPVMNEERNIPVYPPLVAKVSSDEPEIKAPPMRGLSELELLEPHIEIDTFNRTYFPLDTPDFSKVAWEQPPKDVNWKDFPDGPKEFAYDEIKGDLPVSSPGRWMHTSVVLNENEMWVYGGMSTYSDKLYNDMWVYNLITSEWDQLQRSYVSPFPPGEGRPKDIPAPAPFKDLPNGMRPPPKTVPVLKNYKERIVSHTGFVADVWNPETEMKARIKYPEDVAPGNEEMDKQMSDKEKMLKAQIILEQTRGLSVREADGMPRGINADDHPVFLEVESKVTDPGSPNLARDAFGGQGEFGIDYHKILKNAIPSAGHTIGVGRDIPFGMTAKRAVTGDGKAWSEMTGLSGSVEDNGAAEWPSMPIDLWKYNLDSKVWTCVVPSGNALGIFPTPQPATRWLHTAVALANSMVVFGGVSETHQVLGDLWMFDPKSNSWMPASPGGPLPLPREGHAATASGTSMWIYGGVSYGYLPFGDIWRYDIGVNAWTLLHDGIDGTLGPEPVPVARWLTSMAHIPDKDDEGQTHAMLYVFGGVTRDYIPVNDLFSFDTRSKVFQTLKASAGVAPFPRMMHSLVLLKERLFVVGGVANNIVFEDLNYFALDAQAEASVGEPLPMATTGRWVEVHQKGRYPFARAGHSVAVVTPVNSPQAIRPQYPPDHDPPNLRRDPRYRKPWNANQFMVVFGGSGTVQFGTK